MTKVSIIVPIYNVESFLPGCFDSILAQTMTDFEVLAVNDGSPDQCQAIIDQYASKDSRIKPLFKQNGGLSDARNYAIPYVQGEYIFFLDSDDTMLPNTLEALLHCAEKNNSDLVICGYNEVSCNTSSTKSIISDFRIKEGGLMENPQILNRLPHCAWNKLYKAVLFKEKGIRFPKGYYYEDAGTSPIVYLNAKRISYLPMALINYLVDRPGNITQSVSPKIMDILADLKLVNEYYIQYDDFEQFKPELCLFNIRLIYDNLWKLKQVRDKKFIEKFLRESFQHLNYYFPNWKKNEFFNKSGIQAKIMQIIMTNRMLYQRFLTR